jgi:hypothetical protein
MAIRFINLTPFPVRIWAQGRQDRETVFPTSGRTVRIKFSNRVVTSSEMVELRVVEPVSMSELPAQIERDLRYIVSESVFRLVDDRKDFVHPAAVVRDKSGSVVAHQFLACHAKDKVKGFYAVNCPRTLVPAIQESSHV